LDIQDLFFFIGVCDNGFENTCKLYGIEFSEGICILSRLSHCVNFEIFKSRDGAVFDKITESGSIFLHTARRIADDILCCTLHAHDIHNKDFVVIRVNALDAKHFVLPCLAELTSNKLPRECLNLLTYDDYSENMALNSHVLFKPMNMFDKIFFEKRWTVFMSQGLYASEEYMGSMYKLPTSTRELSMHSIIGYGDSFNRDLHRLLNWHISERYGLSFLDPSVMVSSQSVLMNAVEFGLGIGPLRNYCNHGTCQELVRVLPNLNGPVVTIDFGVRKMVPDDVKQLVVDIEDLMLDFVRRMGLKVMTADTLS
jgi:hypothetical protein